MNYHDYISIMEAEGLEESASVQTYLASAKYWQQAINNLALYDKETQAKLTKPFTELKIQEILRGIEMARFEKDMGYKIEEEYDALMISLSDMPF
ncbi:MULTISPECIES: hypothetical protein [Vagococcus]|uniref:hypothetical protein n=1 Tax=Vagococcus TaxID=2737 RepID=UPI002FC8E5AF